jgi:hypothetical protein
MDTPVVDPETMLRLAKNLQAAHSRLTAGEARKWRDVTAEERKVWQRLARTAARVLLEEPAAPPGG